jgi:hypothetical protein
LIRKRIKTFDHDRELSLANSLDISPTFVEVRNSVHIKRKELTTNSLMYFVSVVNVFFLEYTFFSRE